MGEYGGEGDTDWRLRFKKVHFIEEDVGRECRMSQNRGLGSWERHCEMGRGSVFVCVCVCAHARACV